MSRAGPRFRLWESVFRFLLVGGLKSCGESRRASTATIAGNRICLLRPSGMGFYPAVSFVFLRQPICTRNLLLPSLPLPGRSLNRQQAQLRIPPTPSRNRTSHLFQDLPQLNGSRPRLPTPFCRLPVLLSPASRSPASLRTVSKR